MTRTPILQFGTSRFLQAHADLFISEALAKGCALGPITVVQSSGNAARSQRLAALAAPGGYPVRIRGLQDGQPIDETRISTSIRRTLSTATDWPEITRIATDEARIILSNTADAGYAPQPADESPAFDQTMSYPAKLMHLLLARFQRGPKPLQIMPAELIVNNGATLKASVLALARTQPSAFQTHLETDILWVNSLVDRIVSDPIEPAGAIAEPYALWAIEDQPGLILPCTHPCLQVVQTLETTEALKLFLLNLAHTALAEDWLLRGSPTGDLVRLAMADNRRPALLSLYEAELLPPFIAAGLEAQARAYIATTLERFANPFLNHKLSDIADNHAQKISRRVGGLLAFARKHGDHSPKPRLAAIAARLSLL